MAGSDVSRRRAGWTIGAALAASIVGCGSPSIGTDKASFKAVDALYTAVGMRDPAAVAESRGRLSKLRDEGKLPEAAFGELNQIIDRTKGGDWEEAQSRLARFMEGQRR